MSTTEAARHQLHVRLEELLGEEEANSLMEHLPPVGWADVATRRDLDHLEVVLRGEISGLRSDMGNLETSLGGEIGKFEAGLRAEMQTMRAELFRDLHRQTYSMIGSLTAIIAIAVAVLRIG